MQTMVLKINHDDPEPALLQQAADYLRRGGVLAAPTDTVYGLLCDPNNEKAVRQIYQVKGRDFRMPLILLVANVEQVARFSSYIPASAGH